MTKKLLRFSFSLLAIFALLTVSVSSAGVGTNDTSLSCFSSSLIGYSGQSRSTQVSAKASPKIVKGLKLYVGGMPFGVKFMTDGVVVVSTCDVNTASGKINPAAKAGIQANDVITQINGKTISDATSLTQAAEMSGGKSIDIVYTRNGKTEKTVLCPALSSDDGKYKTGMYVRDSGAGIGTVTYIDPETMSFGGLGHGICDSDTGKLIPMQRGSVVEVTINGVVKGVSGAPGEVKGYFSSGKTGTLLKNTDCGVFGAFASLPDSATQLLEVGSRSNVKCGKAYILSTLDGTTPQKYEIEISDIKLGSTSNKCFTVKVTDEALLSKTGGIIQGMSGSPIIQDGKLVGAVTHVLVNDPTTGYGIFIENMLNASATVVTPKAA